MPPLAGRGAWGQRAALGGVLAPASGGHSGVRRFHVAKLRHVILARPIAGLAGDQAVQRGRIAQGGSKLYCAMDFTALSDLDACD